MKALIINGSLKGDRILGEISEITENILSSIGYKVESILINEKKIDNCLGCFGCWIKTPGICVINDYGRDLVEKVMNSDVVIYLTPVTFGGYSSELKRMLDRIIPVLLPFFKKVNGEVHHKERYEKYPKVIVLGTLDEKDEDMEAIFNNLIQRNSLNWYNSFTGGSIIIKSEYNLKTQILEIIKSLGVIVC